MKNILVRSFIIHARSYRETSMIYDVLTSNCGLISILAKGIKKKKDRTCLQPTKELMLSFTDSDFPILTSYEPVQDSVQMNRNMLILILYFNELIYRLIPRNEPYESVFTLYKDYIKKMSLLDNFSQGLILGFETNFLKEIGYELSMADEGEGISTNVTYIYDYDKGFKINQNKNNKDTISGSSLNSLFNNDFESIKDIAIIRNIIRNIIKNISYGSSIKSYDFIN